MKKAIFILILSIGIVNLSSGQFTTQKEEVKAISHLQTVSSIDLNSFSHFTLMTSEEKPASIKWVAGGLGVIVLGVLIPPNREGSAYLSNALVVIGSCAVVYGAYLYWIVESDGGQIGVRISI